MQNLFASLDRPLPETLLEDLEELLSWDNNCFLTWVSVGDDTEAEGARWFTVRFSSDGRDFGLRLEFWIPQWMTARGVAAVLPASLPVAECKPGQQAAVDVGMERLSRVRANLPRLARTCARLINELWGRTESDGILLLAMEYQEQQLEMPFADLPTYGR
jgi:hypothetical protein